MHETTTNLAWNRSFWEKTSISLKTAGQSVLEKALCLYYAAQSPHTPTWAKGVIYGALAYFILPADAIPDFLPVVGYSDDFLALGAAFASVAMCITPEIKAQAEEKLRLWRGEHGIAN